MIQSSQQNTPLNPRAIPTPFSGGSPQPPVAPPSVPAPVSTPIPQVPLEGQGLPAGQIQGEGAVMATPEQRAELEQLMADTQSKMGELQTAKFRSANESEAARIETLKEIFIMMRDAGVDLNEPQSVAEFLAKLKTISPTIGEQFEETLSTLLDGADPQQPDETIQEGVREPLQG